MLVCPDCEKKLDKVSFEVASRSRSLFDFLKLSPSNPYHWVCLNCEGRAVSPTTLCESSSRTYIEEVWAIAQSGTWPHKRSCPSCLQKMKEVMLSHREQLVAIDICLDCELFWFDRLEFERLASVKNYTTRKQRLRELESNPKNYFRRSEFLRTDAYTYEDSDLMLGYLKQMSSGPAKTDSAWSSFALVLGLPVELGSVYQRSQAWLTWGLSIIVAICSIYAFGQPIEFFNNYGLLPISERDHYGSTLFTSFFLHGNWLHLLGNLYFLLIFGDDVEDYLGKFRYAILLLLGTMAGSVAYLLTAKTGDIVAIGASGGISTVIAFYALSFPKRVIAISLMGIIGFPGWKNCTAQVAFAFWMLSQYVGIIFNVFTETGIGYSAHLGGALMGFILFFLWREPTKM